MARSFAVVDPRAVARAPVPPRRISPIVVALLLAALVAVGLARSLWLRAVLPAALVLVAASLAWRARRRRASESATASAPAESRKLALGPGGGLVYEVLAPPPPARPSWPGAAVGRSRAAAAASPEMAETPVLDAGAPFGLTLLSNRRRDRLVAALTSSRGTFLVGTRLEPASRKAFAPLLARSSVHGGDEAALDATGPDGRPVCIPPDAFRDLVEALEALDPRCSERLILSDQRGDPLRLDGEALEIRGARFDLARPLEWRPILFQEAFGHAITLYQGTWVRQSDLRGGTSEVVLVSLLTSAYFESSAAAPRDGTDSMADLDLMALRDQRLLQAAAADPPPTDQRVAVDGIFVVPLRAALDQAPRASSQPARARHV